MIKQTTPYPLRMPTELKELLKKEAQVNGRSLHSELLLRLQASCYLPAPKTPEELSTEEIARRVAREEIAKAIKK